MVAGGRGQSGRRLQRLTMLNHFRRWMLGWLPSVGSGRLTWMLSRVISTARIYNTNEKEDKEK
jgi:hypothetical protein